MLSAGRFFLWFPGHDLGQARLSSGPGRARRRCHKQNSGAQQKSGKQIGSLAPGWHVAARREARLFGGAGRGSTFGFFGLLPRVLRFG